MKTANVSKFVLLALLSLLVGCATVYKTANLRTHAERLLKEFEPNLTKIQQDYNSKLKVVDGLRSTGADFSKFPFNRLEVLLGKMFVSYKKLLKSKDAVEDYQREFVRLEALRAEVKAGESGFSKVRSYKSFAEGFSDQVRPVIEAYIADSTEFSSLTKKSEIFYVYPQKLEMSLTQINHRLNHLVMVKQREILRERKLLNTSDKSAQKKLVGINRMQILVDKIRAEAVAMGLASEELSQNLSKGEKMIIGPHLKSQPYFVNYKAKNLEIQHLLSELDRVEKALHQ